MCGKGRDKTRMVCFVLMTMQNSTKNTMEVAYTDQVYDDIRILGRRIHLAEHAARD